tara:strand:+ start:2884 stop:5316 length:2433 start_codon:yes stop_codon:yes gene_type:complete
MIYKPNLYSITEVASRLEKIPYNEEYIPKSLLQTIIDSNENTYILKHLGAGFTYGCFNLKGNIIIIVPNIQIVKDKEALRGKFDCKNTLFFYGGSIDKISSINQRKNLGNLVICSTIDQFYKYKHLVNDFTWIFDESHSLNDGATYRSSIANSYDVLKHRKKQTIQVTATPPLTIPNIFLNYRFVKLYNPTHPSTKVNITYDARAAYNKIISDFANSVTVAVFSNRKAVLAALMNKVPTNAIVGSNMKEKLLQYDESSTLFEPKDNAQLHLHTSAGTEGHDIQNVGISHVYVFCNLNNESIIYTIPTMIQATGRLRNGVASITFVIEKNKKNEFEEVKDISFEELKKLYVSDAKQLIKEGSPGKIYNGKVIIGSDNKVKPNVFGIHGTTDKIITRELFASENLPQLKKIFSFYDAEIISFDKTLIAFSQYRVPIRKRIDNLKRLGIEKCKDNFDALHSFFDPYSKGSSTPTELKVALIAIYELTFDVVIEENTNKIDRIINKTTNLNQMDLKYATPLELLKKCNKLYRKFRDDFKRNETASSKAELKNCYKKYGDKSIPYKDELGTAVFKKRAKEYNNLLFKNAKGYINAYAFSALHKDKGLVKNRIYNKTTLLSIEQIEALTYGHIVEIDITAANPQFIDEILNNNQELEECNIGGRVYENLMRERGLTRQEAKQVYNKALNKSDEHNRDNRITKKIFLDAGYTPKQTAKLYELTKVKGEIYLKMTKREKEAIDKIKETLIGFENIRLVRRHDSLLIYSLDSHEILTVCDKIFENQDNYPLIHINIYSSDKSEKTFLLEGLEDIRVKYL